MKITAVEPFVVDGGMRPWLFLAIRTDEGITGYSEFGESSITRGMLGLVVDISENPIGKDPGPVEKHYMDMYRAMRQAPGWGTELNEEVARKHAWTG